MDVKHHVVDHPFDLAGMKVGDWFLGCRACEIQLPTNAVGVPRCPNCAGALFTYTVTPEDLAPQAA